MKKFIFLPVLLLIIALLAGCGVAGGGGADTPSEPAGAATAADAGAAAADPAEAPPRQLTIAHHEIWAPGFSINDGLPVFEELARRLDIDITWEVLPDGDQYMTNARARLAAGVNLPDIMRIPGGVEDAMRYARQGLFLRLNPLIESYGPDIITLFERYPEILAGMSDPDGNIYFLANYTLDSPTGRGMVIRRDWAQEHGFDELPRTIDEWTRFLLAVRDHGAGGHEPGTIVPFGGNPRFFSSGFGIPVQQSDAVFFWPYDGVIQHCVMRDEYRDYLEFANWLFTEGMLDPMFGAGQTQIDDLVNQGLVAGNTNFPGTTDIWISTIMATTGVEADLMWYFTPEGPQGQPGWVPFHTVRNAILMGITKDARDPALAMEFFNYVYGNEDGKRLVMAGIEGEMWDWVDGVLTFQDHMINHPQYNIITRLRQMGAFFIMDSQNKEFNDARAGGVLRVTLARIYDNPDRWLEALPSFVPSESEQDVIMQVWPDIRDFIEEMNMRFIMGTEPLENFDAFRATLENLGIERLNEVYQAMYERYKAHLGR